VSERAVFAILCSLAATALQGGCGAPEKIEDVPTPRAAPAAHVPPQSVEDRCRLAVVGDVDGDCDVREDADHDRIPDDEDRCPDTTPGVVVDDHGCAVATEE
jgi:hypothetical protein